MATAMVLPAPGGPVSTVSGHHRVPSATRSVIRWRGTAQAGTSGAVILEVRIGSPASAAARLVRAGALVVCLVRDQVPRSELVRSGRITRDTAFAHCFRTDDLQRYLA